MLSGFSFNIFIIDKTLKSVCCIMEIAQLVCPRNKMEKTANNSAQNFIAKFSVSCALFLLFSFCASGKISVAKPQRVLRAERYRLVDEKPKLKLKI